MSSNAKRVESMTEMLTLLKENTTEYTERIDGFIKEFSTLPDIIIRSMEFSQQQKTWLIDLVEDKLRNVTDRAFQSIEPQKGGFTLGELLNINYELHVKYTEAMNLYNSGLQEKKDGS